MTLPLDILVRTDGHTFVPDEVSVKCLMQYLFYGIEILGSLIEKMYKLKKIYILIEISSVFVCRSDDHASIVRSRTRIRLH